MRAVVALAGLLVAARSFAGFAEDNPPTIQAVTVDGKGMPIAGKSILRLPLHPGVVSFLIGGSTNANHQTLRVRHRLEGYDKRWQEGIVFMYVAVRFFDAEGRQVSQTVFRAQGESPGWKGDVARSDFSYRRETVEVPAKAASIWAVISSAGPPTTVGLLPWKTW